MQLNITIPELIKKHLPAGSLRARMVKGTFWFFCGSIALQVSGMLSGIFCARILGQIGFGELNLLRSTVLMFGVLAGTGLGVLAVKYVSEFRDTKPEHAGRLLGLLFTVSIVTGIAATMACLILASPLACWAMKSATLTNSLRLGSILLLLNTLNGVQMGAICGFESFRTIFRINLLDGILNLTFIPSGAYLFGVAGAIGGSVLATAAGLPIKHLAMRKDCQRMNVMVSFKWKAEYLSELLKTMLPIMVLGIAFYPFEWIAKLFLVRQSGGFAQLGLFAAANSFGAIVSSIPSQLIFTVQPLLGNLLGKRETRSFRRLALFSVLLSGGVALLVALSLSVFSKYVMRAYGANFTDARGVLVIISFANVFFALVIPYHKILIAYNRIWTQAFITALLGLSLVVATSLLRHRGAQGLALSYLTAYLFMFIAQTGIIYKIIKPVENGDGRLHNMPSYYER
jgi:O-antigen/teichoic acid export membrane protein